MANQPIKEESINYFQGGYDRHFKITKNKRRGNLTIVKVREGSEYMNNQSGEYQCNATKTKTVYNQDGSVKRQKTRKANC